MLKSATRPPFKIVNRKSEIVNAFTLVEILVVIVLLSFIILALMTVFSATQSAFRAGITQTDVLEGGRSAMGLIKSDLESMTPSYGVSNGAVNFYVNTNFWQYQSNSLPLAQTLIGSVSGFQRTNVLENFFILTRQNTTWTGVGYFVDTASTNFINPLYRFSISTNVMARGRNIPAILYNSFLNNLPNGVGDPAFIGVPISPTNPSLSHLMDGVVHLTVRAYDPSGRSMTYFITTNMLGGINYYTTNRNVWFSPPMLGEAGFFMYSNTLPAAVQVELGVLEDRTIQRAESLAGSPVAQSNYLAQQAAKVHLFRQRIPIRNVVPSAYQ